MHRTQVYLEDRQYELLRARARREGKTLALVIREALDESLSGGRSRYGADPFTEVIGIGEGDGAAVAENCEEYLYGEWS